MAFFLLLIVLLFRLFRSSKIADQLVSDEVVMETFFEVTRCGYVEGIRYPWIQDMDLWVSLIVFLIWSVFLCWPFFFFFMPMLFGTRDLERWHLDQLLRPLVRPEQQDHHGLYAQSPRQLM